MENLPHHWTMMSCLKDRGVELQNEKAVLARLLFALHGVVTIWLVADVCNKKMLFLLFLPLGSLVVEWLVTSSFTNRGAWKNLWFCPSVLLYLASVIPGIWLLHIDMYQAREYRTSQGLHKCEEMVMFNETTLREVQGISIPLSLPEDEWTSGLQQSMLVVLVLGTWLLLSHLSRGQLSQLLLTYLGIAADSLEFSLETLNIGEVYCNKELIIAVLTIWTWSTLQFTLVKRSITSRDTCSCKTCYVVAELGSCGLGSEIWSEIVTSTLQDVPFLLMRMYLIIKFHVVNQMMLFFVIKNALVISLQLYRAIILNFGRSAEFEQIDANANAGNAEESKEENVEMKLVSTQD